MANIVRMYRILGTIFLFNFVIADFALITAYPFVLGTLNLWQSIDSLRKARRYTLQPLPTYEDWLNTKLDKPLPKRGAR